MKIFLYRIAPTIFIFCFYCFTSVIAQNLITYTIPSQNQLHIPRNSKIIVRFNEAMIDSTLNNNSIVAIGTISGRHFGDIVYDTQNNEMTYTPLKRFASGERVFVSLTNEIKSTSGDSLTPAYSYEFRVKSDTGFNTMTCIKYQDIVGLSTYRGYESSRFR